MLADKVVLADGVFELIVCHRVSQSVVGELSVSWCFFLHATGLHLQYLFFRF